MCGVILLVVFSPEPIKFQFISGQINVKQEHRTQPKWKVEIIISSRKVTLGMKLGRYSLRANFGYLWLIILSHIELEIENCLSCFTVSRDQNADIALCKFLLRFFSFLFTDTKHAVCPNSACGYGLRLSNRIDSRESDTRSQNENRVAARF